MANIAHPGAGRPSARLGGAESRSLRVGLVRLVLFVGAFVGFLAVAAQLS
jgi:hypothetical protein